MKDMQERLIDHLDEKIKEQKSELEKKDREIQRLTLLANTLIENRDSLTDLNGKLMDFICEMNTYLNYNELTMIQSGSRFHQQMEMIINGEDV